MSEILAISGSDIFFTHRQLGLVEAEGSSLAVLVKKAPTANKANEITASKLAAGAVCDRRVQRSSTGATGQQSRRTRVRRRDDDGEKSGRQEVKEAVSRQSRLRGRAMDGRCGPPNSQFQCGQGRRDKAANLTRGVLRLCGAGLTQLREERLTERVGEDEQDTVRTEVVG
ncbi:hypothetical protein PC118_g8611 [Phytophthora cactorum]|uniref:Uncharacterized protein n=1 Tax=Phytophthora cactorum TaxID=29920 RepID=A0A8T0Z8S2_9STRA|nr:hypothetical protein PC111_g19668 [Phytophthora cactorum]KAG2820067.1 hypothetical protein PC112_g11915 [Phytophthora cactorum]KAG2858932.1 hypothetical protein PC113_g9362 [Phytophthora cactorum]KAG2984902.1 hypothetical protein PC118_g8611 [Phytophthora cactorum]KAG3012798.1 hypothetical protein PC119_g12732 [Phytophthora cactorum]